MGLFAAGFVLVFKLVVWTIKLIHVRVNISNR